MAKATQQLHSPWVPAGACFQHTQAVKNALKPKNARSQQRIAGSEHKEQVFKATDYAPYIQ